MYNNLVSKRIGKCWRCGEEKPIYTTILKRYRWEDDVEGKLVDEGGQRAMLCDFCQCQLNRIMDAYMNGAKRINAYGC